jgi:hypothetical protein
MDVVGDALNAQSHPEFFEFKSIARRIQQSTHSLTGIHTKATLSLSGSQ